MGRTQICLCCHRYIHIIIFYLIILFASSSIFTNIVFIAEGRAISNLIEVAQKGIMKEKDLVMVVKSQIGSRPPKCEGRCKSCGHCEAVKVPVEPIVQKHINHYSTSRIITHSSRSDDLSNYKPMSWKCKCGDYFFNP